ncbi:MAG TPA: hypothetical protein VHO03_04705 [Ignavibacteriales bacterium]|nr:hypothetical protein [Ignavibacteriales bacterium]
MARVKNIEAFCNVCNSVTKMELAGDAKVFDLQNKKWAKCKKCKQMIIIDPTETPKAEKLTADNIEIENCSEYSPKKSYTVGESIYHSAWDDYGRVVGKETSSSGQNTINVEFQKLGHKKLIESIL